MALRVSFAAIILLVIWRKHLRDVRGWKAYGLAALFGLALGSMNLCFYLSMSHIPLGITVTIEFLGPLTLAFVLSRKLLDLLWVLLAVCGVFLLAPIDGLGGTSLSLVGVVLALMAGAFWVAYILLSARLGGIFPGGVGLAFGTLTSAIVLLPLGILQARSAMLNPLLLLAGAGVGLLSTALPYSLEMEALRASAFAHLQYSAQPLSSRCVADGLSDPSRTARLARLDRYRADQCSLGWRDPVSEGQYRANAANGTG